MGLENKKMAPSAGGLQYKEFGGGITLSLQEETIFAW